MPLDHPSRVASGDHHLWDVGGNHAARGYHASSANAHTGQNERVCADPDTILNHHWIAFASGADPVC